MRSGRFPHRRRTLFTIGALAACAITTAATVPAYAAPAHGQAAPAHGQAAAVSRIEVPSPNAPTGGTVAGARYGAAASRAAGSTAVTDFLRLHRAMVAEFHGSRGAASNKKLHYWWGSFPRTNSGPGVTATQSISQTLRLTDPSDILYAPTMMAADNSCIEVVTVHTTGIPQIWAWDWCKYIRPIAVVDVNAAFMKQYTIIANGRTAYTTKNVQTDPSNNTWTAYLFNYQTGYWNKLYSQHGTDQAGLSFGWDMFEFYSSTNPATHNTYVCGDLQKAGTQIESSNISIRRGASWIPGSPANTFWDPSSHPNPAAYKCPDIQFNIVQRNSDWMVDVAH
jgi:hypothetical protein